MSRATQTAALFQTAAATQAALAASAEGSSAAVAFVAAAGVAPAMNTPLVAETVAAVVAAAAAGIVALAVCAKRVPLKPDTPLGPRSRRQESADSTAMAARASLARETGAQQNKRVIHLAQLLARRLRWCVHQRLQFLNSGTDRITLCVTSRFDLLHLLAQATRVFPLL